MQEQENSFIAHKCEDDGREQLLLEHLKNTAKLARQFSESFGGGELAEANAFIHDIGKYSTKFQKRVRGGKMSVDHSTPGGQLMKSKNDSILGILAAYCIMGHHGGLPDGGKIGDDSDAPTLYGRLKREVEDCSAYKQEMIIPEIKQPRKVIQDGFGASFFIRMLFSALVDADYLDTEAFFQGETPRGNPIGMNELLSKLNDRIDKYINPVEMIGINASRTTLLKNCISAAQDDSGLFTLTAPTGSGKTIASLAFALNHAVKWNKHRIIYIVPYNTIIEQNAAVFEEFFGQDNVLQHHSNILYDDENEESSRKRLATENWDYPIIVTSSVQFFQSLFGNRPSICRKLHNVADSVLVFDEAQMIPAPYLVPCVRAIRELVEGYNCTAVLATATQSALERVFYPLIPKEISDDPQELFTSLRRVTIELLPEQLSDDSLIARLCECQQVLCIVNTKKMAQNLFKGLNKLRPDETFHLSTLMTPLHRSQVLNEIRDRLKAEQPCLVISTSLVEAGVDLDFPVVYREQAGLDSIIQAAGRCNREGKRPVKDSLVYVFRSAEHKPPTVIKQNVAATQIALRGHDDPTSLDVIRKYFEKLHYLIGTEALDVKETVPKLDAGLRRFSFPFKEIADAFHLIEEDTMTIFFLREAPELEKRLRDGERSRKIFRQLGPHSIQVYYSHLRSLLDIGAIEQMNKDEEIFFLLEMYYDDHCGVDLSPTGGEAYFIMKGSDYK